MSGGQAVATVHVDDREFAGAKLVNALDSVDRNLFGSAVFSAVSPSPTHPPDPDVRISISAGLLIPLAIGVVKAAHG